LTGKSEGTLETVPSELLLELTTQEWPAEKQETVAPIPQQATCEWPLLSGGLIKEPKLCGKPALAGERVCSEHKTQLQRLRGKQ
jgi:hypothetical protein